MATVTIELEAIENLIKALKQKNRIQLIKHLEDNLWKAQLDKVVGNMRKHVRERGITNKEIDRICEDVHKERYEKTQGHH